MAPIWCLPCPFSKKLLFQKRSLKQTMYHWKGKIATRNEKNIFEFFKICWFLGPFLKKQCFWKMGMAGIKRGPRPSTIPSFLVNLNEEALLKVSFKNIDWFQIFFHFWWIFYRAFQWYIVCFLTKQGFGKMGKFETSQYFWMKLSGGLPHWD